MKEIPQQSSEETKSVWTTVTPLSKYLAMLLFVALPFIGGYIGYTFAPVEVVEVDKVVVKEEMQEDFQVNEQIHDEQKIPNFNTRLFQKIPVGDNEYYSAVAKYLEIDMQSILKDETYVTLKAREINNELILLSVCWVCSHTPTEMIVYDKASKSVLRKLEPEYAYNAVPKIWFVPMSTESLVSVAVADDSVILTDYAEDIHLEVYRESDPNISLHEGCELGCYGLLNKTTLNEIIFGRYTRSENHTVGKLVETIVLELPEEYQREQF